MDKQFYDKVTAQVHGLGSTSYDIAESLRLEGIKAVPGQASRCALSRFVKKHYPETRVTTNIDSMNFYDPELESMERIEYHSKALSQFVADFDSLVYPDLIDYDFYINNKLADIPSA